jgi:hypothetical protein
MLIKTFKYLLPFFLAVSIMSCDLGGGEYWTRSDVILDITQWDLPDTSTVSTPFNLYIKSSIRSSCINDLYFSVAKYSDFEYTVLARAQFENHGETCLAIEVDKDTTISITPTAIGKYYYYFFTNSQYVKDSIYIKP